MTFKTAKKKLKALAGERYHSLQYELTEYTTGGLTQECRAYIDDYGWHSAPTWKAVLLKLEAKLTKPNVKIENIEEIKGA